MEAPVTEDYPVGLIAVRIGKEQLPKVKTNKWDQILTAPQFPVTVSLVQGRFKASPVGNPSEKSVPVIGFRIKVHGQFPSALP